MTTYFLYVLSIFILPTLGKGLYTGVPCHLHLSCDPDHSDLLTSQTTPTEEECQQLCRNLQCVTYNWWTSESPEQPDLCQLFGQECYFTGWGDPTVFLGPSRCVDPTVIIGGRGEDGYIAEVETLWPGFGHDYGRGYHNGYIVDDLFDPFPGINIYGHAATNLNSTMIIVCGGDECHGLDLITGSWVTLPPMNYARNYLSLVTLGNHVVAVGGANTKDLEIFDPASNSWINIWPMPEQRSGQCTVVVDEYHIILIGDLTGANMNLTTMLDTLTGVWTRLPDIPIGRYGGHACIKTAVDFSLPEESREVGVMVTGGQDGHSSANDLWPGKAVEFLSLETYTWRRLADSSYSQWDHSMTILESHPPISGFRFDAPLILGGEYEVQDDDGRPETHQRNYVQTFLGNSSDWPNEWDCCVPQLKWKRSMFSAVRVQLD